MLFKYDIYYTMEQYLKSNGSKIDDGMFKGYTICWTFEFLEYAFG